MRRSNITPMDLEYMLCDESADPTALPLSLLEEITDGFSDERKIGSGGFAVVYKGMLENRIVAVKRMSNTYRYEKEFQREVECLMIVKHKNIVRFLGYCADTQGSMEKYEGKFVMADVNQRLLCFEYLPKGSLHEYITGTSRKLRWRHCYEIITGICRGLHYLHHKNILHLDLKPANILLDYDWVPKITDFGISRCFDQMQSQVITNIVGTPGYLAPESFNHTEVTYRNSYRLDIYSLGVVIIEILTGQKGYHDVDKVVESWSDMLEESHREVQLEQVRVCAEIGIECTNFNPSKRPDTQHIIGRLDETKSIDTYTETSMITSHQINPDTLIGTAHTLWLCYQQINPDIRRCMEYCSIFPRESKLRRNQLVCLWIAQDFVKTSCATEDMEDVANGYIQELVSYSFLQPEETSDGASSFTIHGVLHDLLEKAAGNCFRIDNARSQRGKGWEGDVPRDVQHLLIQNYDAKLITKMIFGLENLRTIIVYVVEEDTGIEEKIIESICKRLPKLRVLAVAFSKEHGLINHPKTFWFPEAIRQLRHLRYLSLRMHYSCEVILPSALTKLEHIQLLEFGCANILDFPSSGLIKLRHICCSFMKSPNVGRLILLQTIPPLTIVNEEGCDLKQLRDLNKLRGKLLIEGLENVKSKEEALEANLAAKERVTYLALHWDSSDQTGRPEVEPEVLEGLCPPAGLERLEINYYRGLWYPDWMVGNQNGGLKELRVLKLFCCSLDALPGNMEHLTSLKKLVILACRNIRSLPAMPQSLEEFVLDSNNYKFVKSCATAGHPNWQKIKHVPKKKLVGPGGAYPSDPVDIDHKQSKIFPCINHLRGFWHGNTV